MIKKFGYIRVSTAEQNTDRQKASMVAQGIGERDIYIDHMTGKTFDRPDYQALKRALRSGDVLYIHSLDRLGRDKLGILDEWEDITKRIGADIVVLDMPMLDTTKYKDSIGAFVTDLILQVLSWLAEEELTRLKTRQREGIEAAMKRGQHMGRPQSKTIITKEFRAIYDDWKAGKITGVEATKLAGCSKGSFYRMVKDIEKEK